MDKDYPLLDHKMALLPIYDQLYLFTMLYGLAKILEKFVKRSPTIEKSSIITSKMSSAMSKKIDTIHLLKVTEPMHRRASV